MKVPISIGRVWLGIVLSLAMVVLPLSRGINAADTPVTVSVWPVTNNIAAGGEFLVYLNITQVTNLKFYAFDVTYNSSVIQVVGSEGGDGVSAGLIGSTPLPTSGWTFQPNPGTPSGTIRVPLQNLSGGVSGTGYLARLRFSVVGSGGQASTITPANITLNDIDSAAITVGAPAAGSINVLYPPVTVSISAPASVSAGDDFVARINVSPIANLTAYQIVINYNQFVLQVSGEEGWPSGVTGGLVGSTAIPVDTWGYFPGGTPGTLIALGHIPGAGVAAGSGYLAEIHFHVVGAQGQQSSILFTSVATGYSKLFDNTGTMKTGVTWGGTSVNIISAYRITNASLATGEVGLAYSQTLGATGGVGSYSFSIAAGNLPNGLTLSPAGLISGIPSNAGGPATVTFRVTDSTSNSMTKDLAITIAPPPAITTSSPLPSGSASAFYTQTLSVTGGVAPYAWSVPPGTLPAGLSLNTAGVISGTLTTAGGPVTFTVTVVDSLGGMTNASLAITVLSGPVISSGPALPNGEINVFYALALGVTGGTAPYTWTKTAGTYPAGLSLSTAGVVSGTPTTAGGPTTFSVRVTDQFGAYSDASLSITIVPNPTIATSSPLPTGEVNLFYSRTLTVSGGLSPYTWLKTAGTYPAGLSLSTTGVLSGTPTAAVNPASLTVMVTDSGGKTATQTLAITILAAPVITTPATLTNGQIGMAYSQALAVTGGQAPYSWALEPGFFLPGGLGLSSGGVISGTPTTLGGPTQFVVRVTDNMGGAASATFSLTIVTGPAITTGSPLPNGEINMSYSQTLNVNGGIGPYSWSKTAGALPSGLTLSSSGVISGTPTTIGGPTTATIKVTDSLSSSALKDFTITIVANPTITTSGTLPSGEVNQLYSQTLNVTGGVGPYSWTSTAGNWPAGLNLSSTGIISGTPFATGGPTTVTVKVTDSLNAIATASVSITIVLGPSITTGSTLPGGEATAPYSRILFGTGGVTPYLWQVVSGALPAGLSLSTSGVIAGTPTAAGPATFTVQLTDSLGGSAFASFSLNIVAGPVFTTGSPLRSAEVNVAYSQSLTVSGGTSPYSWTRVSGTLPAGLNFTSAGVVYGTPTAVGGPYIITVKVADNAGGSMTSDFSISVVPGPTITTSPTLPNGVVNLFYSQTLTVSGGVGPYAWSTLSGTWPAGLSLSSAGVVSGTPGAAGGPTTLTVKVTDSFNVSATASLTLTIVATPTITTPSPLPNGEVSALYSKALAVTGGVAPYVWSVPPGTLPAGLTLSGAGVITGTPTTAGGPTTVTISVTDSLGGHASANFTITIVAAPTITTPSPLPNGEVSLPYSKTLTMTGGTSPYTWSTQSGTWPAGLSLSSAGVLSGTPGAAGGPTTITVKVTDSLAVSATASLTLTIVAAPTITILSPLPNGEVSVPYSQVLTMTGGTSPYTWSTQSGTWPAGLTLSSAGVLSGTPGAAGGPTTLTVKVTDSFNVSATASLTLTIIAAPTIVTPSPLPNGEVSLPYSKTLTLTGGTSPYTWSTLSGTWPAGLSLSSAGVLSGTPGAAGGPTTLTVKVTDSFNVSATANLTLTIVAAPTITTPSPLPNGEVSLPYAQTLTMTGGVGPYTWSTQTGTWPAGLSLSSAGVVSGTPGAAGGPTTLSVKVTDSFNVSATASLTLTIVAAPTITTPSPLPNGEVSVPYAQTLTMTGGTSPYTWSTQSGTWPTGLSLSSAGVLSGTPGAAGGPTSITVKVTDSLNVSATASLTLTIIAAPTVTTPSPLPNGEISVPYSQTLTLTGGTSPYTWSTQSGTWPAGLTLSSAGVLSGTPGAAGGPTTLSVKVTDSLNVSASASLTLTIVAAPTITTPSPLPNGEVRAPYAQTLTMTGGTSPYTWSTLSGTWPAGLTLSSAGVLSGTPGAAGGPTTLSVKVTDSLNVSATANLTLTIIADPTITTPSPLPNGEVSLPYSKTLTLTGGTSPYTWSTQSGTWPAGLTLSSAGVVSGTPGAAGGPTTLSVKVTDSFNVSASASLTLTIIAAPTITTPSLLPNGEVSVPYSQTLTLTGGTSPYTWSTQTGTWPAGLSLSSAGVLSGTPGAAGGPTTLSVKVTDSLNVSASASLTLTIVAAPTITTSSPLPNGEVSVPYAQTLTMTGGTSPYTWSTQSGTWPTGLTLSSAGVLSGTPGVAGGPTTLTVKVTDSFNMSATASLTLTIVAAPTITTPSLLPNGEVSLPYLQTLTLTGGTSPYTWSTQSGTWPAGLTLSSAGVLSGTPGAAGGPTTVTVKVTDSLNVSATANLTLTIVTAPTITTPSPLPNGEVSVPYAQTLTLTGGTSPYTWSTQSGTWPAGLTLSSAGVLSGTPGAAGGPTSITVKVTDSLSVSSTASLTLTIIAAPTVTTPSPLPNGEVSLPYAQTLTLTGGTSPYTWSTQSGTWPAGLSLSSAGVLSGTPGAAGGPTTVIVKVTDSLNVSATASLTLTIVAAPTITTPSPLPNGEVSLPYLQTLTMTGGTSPYAWTTQSGTWPAGLTLSSAGVLSGTPGAAGGPTTVIVKVTDSFNVSASASLTLTIVAAPTITTPSPLPNGEVRAPYSKTLTMTGGTSPYTWSTQSGTWPAGLTLSSAGVISGTPGAAGGPTTLTVKVTDSLNVSATANLTLTIVADPTITTPSPLPNGEVSLPYLQTLTLTGGTSPYTWSTLSGTWPAGLSLSSAGVLSGTPGAAGGPTTLSVKVTDSLNVSSSASLTLTIIGAPTITTPSPLPNGEVSLPYAQTLTMTGGTSPYTWSTQSGTWPAGLTLSSAGVLSGTPGAAGGPTTLTVKVTDSFNVSATASLTLTIIAAPTITTPSPLPNGEVGISYSMTLTGAGGTAPYAWNTTGLPAGLTISASGVISGIPTEAGDFSINATYTDSYSPPGSVNQTFSLHIYNAIQIIFPGLAEVLQGKPYNQILAASGGNAAYTWSANGLPAGLTISAAGVINGIPTEAGDFLVNISLTDSLSGTNSVVKVLTLKVYMPYDANGNGFIDMGDVVKVERIILNMDPITPAADANGIPPVDMGDIVKIERVILGIEQ